MDSDFYFDIDLFYFDIYVFHFNFKVFYDDTDVLLRRLYRFYANPNVFLT